MSKYSWDFTLPESVLKTQATLNGLTASALAMSDVWKAVAPHYDLIGASAALNAYLDNYESISKQIDQMTSIAKSVLPLIDTSAYAALLDTTAIKAALTSVDWSWLSEVYPENDDNDDPATTLEEKEATPAIRAEMAADITEVIAEPETMHLTSRNKYLEWAKKSPALAIQFVTLLLMFIQTICMMVQTWQARPVKDSQVYQEPASTSNVVYNLTVENSVTVIGDAPYYYEVEFVNPETGETMTGYVYKANITVADGDEADEQEETMDAEETQAVDSTEATESQTTPTE